MATKRVKAFRTLSRAMHSAVKDDTGSCKNSPPMATGKYVQSPVADANCIVAPMDVGAPIWAEGSRDIGKGDLPPHTPTHITHKHIML